MNRFFFAQLAPFLVVSIFFGLLSESLNADDKSKALRHGRMKKMTCVGCHGMTGKGAERDGQPVAPSYEDSLILKHDPEMLALILLKGIENSGTYAGAMPGMEAVYNDHDLASVMTFLRNRWGGHDDYITDAQAAGWRAKHAGRTEPVTQAELEESRKSASPE